jgi:predicted DNA-binding transcriptional regulator YafY
MLATVAVMRASRLLAILLLLQSRGRMTAGALADELEVSVRTIYRDIQALSESGVPVYAEAGPGGGVQLVDGYRTRLTGLTAAEAETLFLAGVPGPVAELGLGTVLAAAQLKVLAALPPELRSRATRVSERFHLDAPGWFGVSDDVSHLPALAEALWGDRVVEVGYRARRDGPVSNRRLEPLGLVLKAGVWYLVARSRGRVLTYRASRLEGVTVTDERFERPEEFDLAGHWSASQDEFVASMYRSEVRARVAPDAMRALRMSMEPTAARRTMASVGPPDAEGWLPVVIPVEELDYTLADLLRLGDQIEVLEPPELRDRIADAAHRIVARYSGAPVSASRE